MTSIFDTRSQAQGAVIPSADMTLGVNGYSSPGDGGAAVYKRISAPSPVQAWHFQSSGGAWWELAELVVSPSMLGAVGDGVANDTAAIKAAFQFPSVELPAGKIYIVTTDVTLGLDNQVLRGPGAIQFNKPNGGAAGVTCSLIVTGDRVRVEGAKLIGNALERPAKNAGVIVQGDHCVIFGNEVTGTLAEYIKVSGGSWNRIENNFLNGETFYTNSGIVIAGTFSNQKTAEGNAVIGNRLHWVRGFGIQTRLFAGRTTIALNQCYSPVVTMSGVPATATQNTTWTFTAPWFPNRYGVLVDDRPVDRSTYAISRPEGSPLVTLTFAAALPVGTIPSLLMFYSLESININSRSYETQVIGNQINGSGDSGIVLCSDYTNGNIDPEHTTPNDYPKSILVQSNAVKNCNFSAIAMTSAVPDVSIIGNHISEWSLGGLDEVFGAGILLTAQGMAKDNTILFNGRTTRYGVTQNASIPSPMKADGDAWVKIGSQIFSGTPEVAKIRIPNTSTTSRRTDILLTDQPMIRYPGQIDIDTPFAGGQPADTAYLQYGHVGTGAVRDLADRDGGVASVYCKNGDYVDVLLKSRQMLMGTILQVEFSAKAALEQAEIPAEADGGTGFFRIFTDVAPPATPVGPVMPISRNTSYSRYTYRLAITEADQINGPIRLRFGAGANSVVHFQHFDISYQRIPQ